jgi:hypothetical protein
MKSKITIIDVDLGVSVQDLIDKEVEVFTGETKKLVDKMVEAQKQVQATKQKIEEEKQIAVQTLEQVYNDLDAAGDTGLPVKETWERVKDVVSTPSAFTLKMKNLMTEKGCKKLMIRAKINKVEHYIFK